ncbi:hypothetical protein GCM10027082_20100 [Comamonas humi]
MALANLGPDHDLYAEMMLAWSTGLVAIPDELRSEEAVPILCAGIATFNAVKKCGAQAGDTVAILGIGGLGHMALQYARRMGSALSPSGAAATSRRMRWRWALTSISTTARKMLPRDSRAWAVPRPS